MSHQAPQPGGGFLLIISGPSGVGKSTITNAVREVLDADLSISMTTRPKANGDAEGEHYHFVNRERFEQAIEGNELLEWAQMYGNYYGTPRGPVNERLARGRIVILEIDAKGAEQVKRNMPGAFAVFILAPSEEALLNRLRTRKREDEATIQLRYSRARSEIEEAKSSRVYDAFIINDDLDRAVNEVVDLVRAEMRRRRSA